LGIFSKKLISERNLLNCNNFQNPRRNTITWG
jgi:hypothetical protein